jgi:environmental stress-induced protein Ves
MKLLRAADRTPRPWKNGGGETTDVYTVPPGADLDRFDWRVSIATVASDGPFSVFPGIDRLTAILSGEGFVLEVQDRRPATLTPASDALAYPGDVPTSARLLGGPVRDLNVMTRRGRIAATMTRLSLDGHRRFDRPGLLLWLSGEGIVAGAPLAPLDAVLSEGEPLEIHARAGQAWWAGLDAA